MPRPSVHGKYRCRVSILMRNSGRSTVIARAKGRIDAIWWSMRGSNQRAGSGWLRRSVAGVALASTPRFAVAAAGLSAPAAAAFNPDRVFKTLPDLSANFG